MAKVLIEVGEIGEICPICGYPLMMDTNIPALQKDGWYIDSYICAKCGTIDYITPDDNRRYNEYKDGEIEVRYRKGWEWYISSPMLD